MLRQAEHQQRNRQSDVRRGQRLQGTLGRARQRLARDALAPPSRSSIVPSTSTTRRRRCRTGVESTRCA
jgi:hypothetical protein